MPPGQRTDLMPAVANAGTMAGLVGSNQAAMFIPTSWPETAGPMLDWLTATALAETTFTAEEAPVAGL